MEYSNLFVCLMGICTVFIGLICIIILISIMSGIMGRADRKKEKAVSSAAAPAAAVPAPAAAGTVTPQMAAAVSAVIAEEMGTDVSGLRIVSFKKINS